MKNYYNLRLEKPRISISIFQEEQQEKKTFFTEFSWASQYASSLKISRFPGPYSYS